MPRRKVSQRVYQGLMSDFIRWDSNHDGTLEHSELVCMLQDQLEREPSAAEISAMVRLLDPYRTGRIGFPEYMHGLCDGEYELERPDELSRQDLVNAILERMIAYGLTAKDLRPKLAQLAVDDRLERSSQVQTCFMSVGIVLSDEETSELCQTCLDANRRVHIDKLQQCLEDTEQALVDRYSEEWRRGLEGGRVPKRMLRHAQLMLSRASKLRLLRDLLRIKLEQHTEATGNSIEAVFQEAASPSGYLDPSGLLHLCAAVGIQVDWIDLELLLANADLDRSGAIDLHEFQQFVSDGELPQPMLSGSQLSGARSAVSDFAVPGGVSNEHTLLGMFKDMLWRASTELLMEEFVQADQNHDSKLSMDELTDLLQRNGFPVTVAQVQELCTLNGFDANGDLAVSLDEFKAIVAGWDVMRTDSLANELKHKQGVIRNSVKSVNEAMQKNTNALKRQRSLGLEEFAMEMSGGTEEGTRKREQLRELFMRFDSNSDGALSVCEVRRMLQALGIDIDPCALTKMFARYDRQGDGKIDVNDFVRATQIDGLFHNVQQRMINFERERDAFSVNPFDNEGSL